MAGEGDEDTREVSVPCPHARFHAPKTASLIASILHSVLKLPCGLQLARLWMMKRSDATETLPRSSSER